MDQNAHDGAIDEMIQLQYQVVEYRDLRAACHQRLMMKLVRLSRPSSRRRAGERRRGELASQSRPPFSRLLNIIK